MSNNTEMQDFNDSNEWIINGIEKIFSKKHIKYYEHKDFHNIEKIDNEIYRANYKNSKEYFALKSFNLDNITIKEVVHEFELYNEVKFHKNIIQFFGITESQNGQFKKYLLVMEYADGGSLQDYLKENFKKLTWEDKYKLAFQLTCVISCLHDNGIVHHDLHSGNILVHQNIIKLANFGLSRRIKEASKKQQSDFSGKIPYIDPKMFICSNNLMQQYSLNEKSDVYSIGVLLWEISSGQQPFKNELYDTELIMRIIQGYRETIISDTPIDYFNLYNECWNVEPDHRPDMNQVVAKLKAIITKDQAKNYPQNFDKIKEMEPTTQNIHEIIFDEDLSIVIDDLVNLYFKDLNKGKRLKKKYMIDYINNKKINLREIYDWLLNNQNDSNSIFLFGYFNYHGIEINVNKQKAFELYLKATSLGNDVAQYNLANMYIDGDGVEKNHDKAYELSTKLAKKGYPSAMNMLGYHYEHGFGTDVNGILAFEFYQSAADLGNSQGINNLGCCHFYGIGTNINMEKAVESYQESADLGNSDGMNNLGCCYYNGSGIDMNKQKAFELYQMAANLENELSQYNLGLMYENGNYIKKDINQAIYWYKKSAKQDYKEAQNKLNKLLKK
ncbi:kinase-like domain-containing protein [Glomus cerebriforme]|uniref:Kinase-like domain-containing protein n=1 Tax=Glomus cerebriforme TaxID=658196 RepID=A0A397TTG7_9GLOM|nr:kinase-like domain-containing protein [Glomus cerebriforme]